MIKLLINKNLRNIVIKIKLFAHLYVSFSWPKSWTKLDDILGNPWVRKFNFFDILRATPVISVSLQQARNQDFSREVQRIAPQSKIFFFLSNAWFVFTVVYGFLNYIVNVRYKD